MPHADCTSRFSEEESVLNWTVMANNNSSDEVYEAVIVGQTLLTDDIQCVM